MIDLDSHINILYGTNEAGKTTIHTFLRGMLFGIEKQRGRAINEVYSRYKPWDTPSLYAGEMEVVTKEGTFLIQRNFYKEEKEYTVIHRETGRTLDIRDQKGSCFIEELTESNFSNTISIGQLKAATTKELAFQLNDYITNMSMARTSEVNVAQALKELQIRRKQIEGNQTRTRLENINQALKEIESTEFLIKEMEKQLEKAEAERLQLEERLRKLKVQPEYLKKLEVLESFVREYPLIKEKYSNYQDLLAYREDLLNRLNELKEREKSIDIGLKGNEKSPLDTIEKEFIDHNRHFGLPIMLICTISILCSILLCIYFLGITRKGITTASLLLGMEFIVGVLVHFYRRNRNRIPLLQGTLENASLATKVEERELHTQRELMKENLQKYQSSIDSLNRKIQAQELGILDYARNMLDIDSIKVHSMELLEQEMLKLEAQVSKQKESINKVHKEMEVIQESIEATLSKREKLKWEIAKLEEKLVDYEEQRQIRGELVLQLGKEEKELKAIDIAVKVINELMIEIHDGFGQRFNTAVSELSNKITNGSCYDVRIDEKLNLQVVRGNDFIPLESLSTGTMDQLYLALRMVTANLLFQDKSMPLIFDDAFAFYDEERLEQTLCELAASSSRQIILFTCHKREMEIYDRNQIPYNYIEI
jgi:uncharacterized protein YhaN